MNKKLISLAVAAAIAAPAAALADATVYGKVRVAVESLDVAVDDGSSETDHDYLRVHSYASRIGVKGSEDLGDGLKAIYKMEFQVSIADAGNESPESPDNPNNHQEFSASSPVFSGRNAYVGLAGGWGTLLAGRHDTPLKMSTGKLDYFGDTAGDNNAGYTEDLTDRRADGTLMYVSPNLNGLSAAVALIPGENNVADGLTDGMSAALMYSNAGFYASIAAELLEGDLDSEGGTSEDRDQYRLGLGYDGGNWRVAGVWEEEEKDDSIDAQRWHITGAMDFGMNTVNLKYFDVEDDETEAEHDGFALKVDHNFSKRTQAYVIWVDSEGEDSSGDDTETQIFGVGLNHSF